MRRFFFFLAFALFSLNPVKAQNVIQLEPVISALASPILATSARDGSNRLFIVEQPGRIRVMASPTATTTTVFLDLTAKISCCGERGLLGLAFHPQYATNRKFYVNYTRPFDGTTVVAEYLASAGNPNVADTAERLLLTVDQPFPNHNGGMIAFGQDGFLYIGMGDGGDGNDPGNRAQNIENLLGKMLRIDVNNKATGLEYAIPTDNPFVNVAGRDEIYATGLRNPWRWSFDRQTGDLFAGDVGQGAVEEIDIIRRGGNYGWRVLEGTRCTNLGPGACNNSALIPPIYEYPQVGANCGGSVTGGYVYRGTRSTFPTGAYVFADYCKGTITQLNNSNGAWQAQLLMDTAFFVSAFGEDEAGELYVLSYAGTLYRLVSAAPRALSNVSAASFEMRTMPESIVAAFGTGMATGTQAAATVPLPTALLETRVYVRNPAGTETEAQLFYVSPTQINFLMPPSNLTGTTVITIVSGAGQISRQTISTGPLAPGLFALNGNGRGIAAAVALRIKADGSQSYESIARFDQTSNQWVPVPIELGPETDRVFLAAYGTGFRFAALNLPNANRATIGGMTADVIALGAQGQFAGLDQVNLLIPRSLIGRGLVDVVFTTGSLTANTVQINIR
ncbi:MAG: hypothetical protein HOP19_02360 [Acidobacteria bacterium]|nr:hypothetical protein [Acidobacteriota bacterium]